jgi:hypothetical protein
MDLLTCKICDETKPKHLFKKDKNYKKTGGFRYQCKACDSRRTLGYITKKSNLFEKKLPNEMLVKITTTLSIYDCHALACANKKIYKKLSFYVQLYYKFFKLKIRILVSLMNTGNMRLFRDCDLDDFVKRWELSTLNCSPYYTPMMGKLKANSHNWKVYDDFYVGLKDLNYWKKKYSFNGKSNVPRTNDKNKKYKTRIKQSKLIKI